MKKTFTILSVLMVLGSKAQTITYSNFLTSISSVDTVVIANNSSFNMALTTTTGTVIWNATSLTAQSGVPTVHLIFGNVAATPNGNLYPSSSYVLYDPALTALVSYNYFQLNADSLTDEGSFDPSASHEIFQNPTNDLYFLFHSTNRLPIPMQKQIIATSPPSVVFKQEQERYRSTALGH